MKSIWQKTKKLSSSRFVSIAALLILIAAIPFTIFINQQRTNTQQRASVGENDVDYEISSSCLNSTCREGDDVAFSASAFSQDPDNVFVQHVDLWLQYPDGNWEWIAQSPDVESCEANGGCTAQNTINLPESGQYTLQMVVFGSTYDGVGNPQETDSYTPWECDGDINGETFGGSYSPCGGYSADQFEVQGTVNNPTTQPTTSTGATFQIRGYKVLDPGQDDTGPQSNLPVELSGGANQTQTQNPFFFTNLSKSNNYTVTVITSSLPSGYRYTGFDACINRTDCHTQTVFSGVNASQSFQINPSTLPEIQNGSYVDLYFHFQSTTSITPTGTANAIPSLNQVLMQPQPNSQTQPYAPGQAVTVQIAGSNIGHFDTYYTDNINVSPTSIAGVDYQPIPFLTAQHLSNPFGVNSYSWVIPTNLAPIPGAGPKQYWLLVNVHSNTSHGSGIDWYPPAPDNGCAWDGRIYDFLTAGSNVLTFRTSCTNVGKYSFWVGTVGTTPTITTPVTPFVTPTNGPTSTPQPTTTGGPTAPVATSTQTPTNPVASNTPSQTGIPTQWRITGASNVGFNPAISQVYQGTVTDTTPPYEITTPVQLSCPAGDKVFIGQFFVDGQWVGANGTPGAVVSGTINYTGNCGGITPTSGPTPTTVPTATSAPTPTFTPGGIQLGLKLNLTAIGHGGTANPLHPQRQANVQVFDSNNNKVADKTGPVTFDTTSGNFNGSVDLGAIPAGNYTIKVKTDRYLRKLYPGIRNLVVGANTMPENTLIVGDVNGDNKLDILDYNILRDCGYGAITPLPMTDPNSAFNKASCSSHPERPMTDLDDNGTVNAVDYNYFVRSLATQNGD